MKRSRFAEERIVAVLREHEAGAKAAELCRKYGMSEATSQTHIDSFAESRGPDAPVIDRRIINDGFESARGTSIRKAKKSRSYMVKRGH
jgi:hypothetical protein